MCMTFGFNHQINFRHFFHSFNCRKRLIEAGSDMHYRSFRQRFSLFLNAIVFLNNGLDKR